MTSAECFGPSAPTLEVATFKGKESEIRLDIVDTWERVWARQKAPPGKYRVISVDTFEPPGEGDCIVGDYQFLEEALGVANSIANDPMCCGYVYDDRGSYLCGSEGSMSGPSLEIQLTTEKILPAEKYARRAHEGQYRRDGVTPYTNHLQTVVVNLRKAGVNDEDMLCAAWLHDTVEDRPDKANFEEIERLFGLEVGILVRELTKEDNNNNNDFITSPAHQEKEKRYRKQLARASWKAKVVKLCDTAANVSDLENHPIFEDREVQVKEKISYIEAIRGEISKHNSEVLKANKVIETINSVLEHYGFERILL